jgi:hypothetical protein
LVAGLFFFDFVRHLMQGRNSLEARPALRVALRL